MCLFALVVTERNADAFFSPIDVNSCLLETFTSIYLDIFGETDISIRQLRCDWLLYLLVGYRLVFDAIDNGKMMRP